VQQHIRVPGASQASAKPSVGSDALTAAVEHARVDLPVFFNASCSAHRPSRSVRNVSVKGEDSPGLVRGRAGVQAQFAGIRVRLQPMYALGLPG